MHGRLLSSAASGPRLPSCDHAAPQPASGWRPSSGAALTTLADSALTPRSFHHSGGNLSARLRASAMKACAASAQAAIPPGSAPWPRGTAARPPLCPELLSAAPRLKRPVGPRHDSLAAGSGRSASRPSSTEHSRSAHRTRRPTRGVLGCPCAICDSAAAPPHPPTSAAASLPPCVPACAASSARVGSSRAPVRRRYLELAAVGHVDASPRQSPISGGEWPSKRG